MKQAATKSGKIPAKKKPAAPSVRQAKADTAPPAEAEKPPAGALDRTAAPSLGAQEQSDLFDQSIKLFRSGSFSQAKGLFERAAKGSVADVAHAARAYAQMCERRLAEAAPAPMDAEGHYNLGIALINRRDLDRAEQHLLQALKLAPNGDHILYALALARGLRGEFQLAAETLRRAIEISPRNRTQARNDPDFAEFSQQPPVAAVLFPDRERHS